MVKVIRGRDVNRARNLLVAEASALGLGPGEWPEQFALLSSDGDSAVLFGPDHSPIQGGGRAYRATPRRNGPTSPMELHVLND